MTKSLLEKAKETQKTITISQEHVELALAWAREEISIRDVGKAINKAHMSSYIVLALGLKEYLSKLR